MIYDVLISNKTSCLMWLYIGDDSLSVVSNSDSFSDFQKVITESKVVKVLRQAKVGVTKYSITLKMSGLIVIGPVTKIDFLRMCSVVKRPCLRCGTMIQVWTFRIKM